MKRHTGLRVRRYGPFATQHRALVFFDRVIDDLVGTLNDGANLLEEYQVKSRPFDNRNGRYPEVEDEVIVAAVQKADG